MFQPIFTYVIIALTVIASWRAFNSPHFAGELIFNPYAIKHNKQWFRFISSGFIHADMQHLIFNMITLFFFGRNVEYIFSKVFPGFGSILYVLFYLSALVISGLYTYFKYNDNPGYNALGASGAVSAVLFCAIAVFPTETIYVYFIPIPGIAYAILYLIYSFYMAKQRIDNIGHEAHISGALYGITMGIIILVMTNFQTLPPAIQNLLQ